MTGLELFTSYNIGTGITSLRFSNICHPDRTWSTNIKTEKELKKQKNELKRTKKNLKELNGNSGTFPKSHV